VIVLSRWVNDSIAIGDDITVTVVSVGHGMVRLGIEAPREVPVVRLELIRRERDGAAATEKGGG
jgi:carbon storage regulator